MFYVKTSIYGRLFISRMTIALAIAGALLCALAPLGAAAQGVLRIAAVVNEDVISAYDLANRVRMVILTSKVPDTPETRRRLSSQVLRNMIDERLQLQEAKRLSVSITEKEVDDLLLKLNQQNNLPAGGLEALLARARVDANALKAKVRADHTWNKLIRQRLQRQVTIGDDEVEEELQRLKAVQHLPRHRVAEIFLPVDNPDNEKQVQEVAQRLIQQIRAGARFDALAREFSQSASAAVGGDLGWVTKGQLDPKIDDAIATMQRNDYRGPLRTLAGFHILFLIDRKTPSTAGSGGQLVDLTQVILPLGATPTEEEVRTQQALAQEVRGGINSCDDMRAVAKTLNAPTSRDLNGARVADLPEAVRAAVKNLQIGQTSQPVRVAGGLLLATLCGRTVQKTGGLPSRDEILRQMGNQRFNLLVQRYMRDLRRTAFVDIRG